MVEEVAAEHAVDRRRVYVVGFSNGGFMSYRLACDHADRIAAIVSISGATYADPDRCAPSEPVAVLEVHGTDDRTIPYDGGMWFGLDPTTLLAVAPSRMEHLDDGYCNTFWFGEFHEQDANLIADLADDATPAATLRSGLGLVRSASGPTNDGRGCVSLASA